MDTSPNTSAEGAALGAAAGVIIAWLFATFTQIDATPIQGAIVVVVTYILGRLIPPRNPIA